MEMLIQILDRDSIFPRLQPVSESKQTLEDANRACLLKAYERHRGKITRLPDCCLLNTACCKINKRNRLLMDLTLLFYQRQLIVQNIMRCLGLFESKEASTFVPSKLRPIKSSIRY